MTRSANSAKRFADCLMMRVVPPVAWMLVASTIAAQDGSEGEALVQRLRDPDTRASAAKSLLRRGALSVPFLVDALRQHAKEPGPDALAVHAARLLGELRGAAAPAVKDLLTAMRDGDHPLATACLAALPQIPGAADAGTRALVADGLMEVGLFHGHRSIVPQVLSAIALPERASVQELVGFVADGDAAQKIGAAARLAALTAVELEPALDELVVQFRQRRDLERTMRTKRGRCNLHYFQAHLATALVKCAPAGEGVEEAAVLCLRQGLDPETRRRAAWMLGQLPDPELDSVTALADMLDDTDPGVTREAVTALGVLGPRASGAAGRLEELTRHPDRQVAERARVALRQARQPGR